MDATPLQCALYDSQYVGCELGVLDLIYFLATSVYSSLLTRNFETKILEFYHTTLLESRKATTEAYPTKIFMQHWELAIVDWYRFMAGWRFWGNDEWVERQAREIVSGWNADPSTWTFTKERPTL